MCFEANKENNQVKKRPKTYFHEEWEFILSPLWIKSGSAKTVKRYFSPPGLSPPSNFGCGNFPSALEYNVYELHIFTHVTLDLAQHLKQV